MRCSENFIKQILKETSLEVTVFTENRKEKFVT